MKKIVSIVLLMCMLLGLCACNEAPAPNPTLDPSVFNPTGPLYDRDNYTVADDVAISAHSKVVANVGTMQITNGFLQLSYWSDFFSYMDERGSWAVSQGLIYDKPLNEQIMPRSTCTWQQYFLKSTLDALHENYALYNEAMLANITFPEEMLQELEDMPETLRKTAEEAGIADALSFVQLQHGPGSTVEDFVQFMRLSYVSSFYYSYWMENFEITEQAIEDYMKLLESEGVQKDESLVYTLRHILVEVKEDGTEDDWTKAQQEAQKLLNDWLAGEATEDSFADLAREHSDDLASAYEGGIYRGVWTENGFDEAFKAWFLDESRRSGDYGIVKSEFGYHVMYFVRSEAKWHFDCTNGVFNTEAMRLVEDAKQKHPLTVDYNAIALGYVDTSKSVG